MKALAFLLALTLAACAPTELRKQPDDCKQLQKKLKAGMSYHKTLAHFQIEDTEVADMLSMPIGKCLSGISRPSLVFLLGNPSMDDGTHMDYHLSSPCRSGTGSPGCKMIRFTFGPNGLRAHATLETSREN
jgi:hypothetical protein